MPQTVVATRVPHVENPRTSRFQLFVEELGENVARRTVEELPLLDVPAGISHLDPAADTLEVAHGSPQGPAFVLEPVEASGRRRLLLLAPPGLRARRNGLPVPAVALLDVGDQLQLDARAVLHVTELREGGAVPPPSSLVGQPCGVCRLPLLADTTVVICGCGLPLHLEGPPKPVEDRLQCGLLAGGECPSCTAPIRPEGGRVWLPEL